MDKRDSYLLDIQLKLQGDKAFQKLNRELEEAAKNGPRAAAGMQKIQKGFKKTQIEARQFGRGLQNASYQVQDMIVQISGGVAPLRSMSQQLPQLLINMGAFGAVVGVVAAGLPILIQSFIDSADSADSLDSALETLTGTVSDLGSVSEVEDFETWKQIFNDSAVAIREANVALLEFQVTRARFSAQNVQDSIAAEAGGQGGFFDFLQGYFSDEEGGAGTLVQSIKAFTSTISKAFQEGATQTIANKQALKELAEEYNITTKQAEYFLKIQERGTELTDEEIVLLQRWASALAEVNGERPSDAFLDRIQQLTTINDLLKNLAEGERTAAEARERIASGTNFPIEETVAGLTDVEEATVSVGAAARIAANDWAQMQAEFAKGNQTWEQYLTLQEDVQEQTQESNKYIDLFDRSFDTMLNGVLLGTRTLEDAFTDMAKVIIAQLLKIAAYQTIGGFLSGQGGTLGAIGDSLRSKSADGNVFNNGNVVPFARGGIVNGPTVFPMANGGVGLMGEAGPEAVLPLSRGSDGKLGVSGGGMNVTINNMAAGVDVNAVQTDNGLTIDVVMRQLTNAISQGGNDVSTAIENTYSLGRGRAVY